MSGSRRSSADGDGHVDGDEPLRLKLHRPQFSVAALSIPGNTQDLDDSSWSIDTAGQFRQEGLVISDTGIQSTPPATSAVAAVGDGILSYAGSGGTESPSLSLGSTPGEVKPADLKMLREIGTGNSGVVYAALHIPSDRVVAVKIISVLDREARHQLVKELRTLHDATCVSLVSFFGAYYEDASTYIVMELMDAGSLLDLMGRVGPIPERVLACIARQVLVGLRYLHSRHQLHRDIKPSNIAVNTVGEAKLMDFGITAQMDDSVGVCDSFVGTYNYMSPERIVGKEYSYKSDVWSFGIVMLECALGRFPYPLTGVYLDLMQNIVAAPPAIPDTFSDDFNSFISCCLRTSETDRSSVADLLVHPFVDVHSDSKSNCATVADWLSKAELLPSPVSLSTPTDLSIGHSHWTISADDSGGVADPNMPPCHPDSLLSSTVEAHTQPSVSATPPACVQQHSPAADALCLDDHDKGSHTTRAITHKQPKDPDNGQHTPVAPERRLGLGHCAVGNQRR